MNRKKNLLILGAGQYGIVAKETAQAMGAFEKIEFLDDNNPAAIGKLEAYASLFGQFSCAFVAMGNSQLRLQWMQRLENVGYELSVLIHPMAWISPSASLMPSVIVEPMAVVQAGAKVNRGTLICAGAVVNHNSVVGEGCQIDCGSIVPSNADVAPMTKVPCGSVAGQNKR